MHPQVLWCQVSAHHRGLGGSFVEVTQALAASRWCDGLHAMKAEILMVKSQLSLHQDIHTINWPEVLVRL